MVKYAVIADDLTGANATGALLKKLKLKTVNLINSSNEMCFNKEKYEAIVCSTDSRAMNPKEAYDKVFNMVKIIKNEEIKIYNKRIDSTLRGNIGAEIDAILEGLGEERIAVIVPSFPDAGRKAIGGYLLVNGNPLEESDAANDPKKPISTSVIKKIIEKQTKYELGYIDLETVMKGKNFIKESFYNLHKECKRLIILDAVNNKNLEIIAKALIETDLKFVTVDPGPFTAAVAKEFIKEETHIYEGKKVLMSVGSITNTTKIQLDKIVKDFNVVKVNINTEKLLNGKKEQQIEMERVEKYITKNKDNSTIFCIAIDSIYPTDRVDLNSIAKKQNTTKEELSLKINDSIAEISFRILKNISNMEGIFSSGGDISVAICKKFKSIGLDLLGEVIPLAAYGSFIGGEFPQLKIVSKGGMVGDENGMKVCVKYLLDEIEKEE